jgi:hypothetical protein
MYFGDDKKLLESAQSEYHLRLRTYQNCYARKNTLIKDKNRLYENYQARVKEFEKTKLIGVCGFLAYLVANWFFNFVSEEKIGTFVAFAFAYVAYLVLAEKIYESEYSQKMQSYEFEIARYESETSKLGIYSNFYSYNDTEDFNSLSEEKKNKIRFENECFYTDYRLQILEGMCVIDENSLEASLKSAE